MACDVRADLIAACADGGPQRGVEIGGFGAEAFAHGLDGAAGDSRHGAAPARVNRRHGATVFVGEQNRHAVRGFDCHDTAGRIFKQGVALAQLAGAPVRKYAGGGVHLLHRGQTGRHAGEIGQTRTETVEQPGQSIQGRLAINFAGVFIHKLCGTIDLRDPHLLLEVFQHGFLEPHLGRPFDQGRHLINFIL